ncbi:MAG TPA: methionine--tRNA ligase [Chthoniobacteraceae bacterium]|jgi:methionyl-tRNA synthetase
MAETLFITTAIDYTNGAPHIGHAYEKILADVIARYHRLKGDEVFFLTGVDQHGQKVQQSAEKQGIAPQQFVDQITAKFVALWEKLDVRYDAWAATTDERHKQCVRGILQRLWDDKDETGESRWIYKARQGGWYSVRQEQFLTDKERGEDGEFGPEWGHVEFREEENYYFRLANHRQWLLDLIEKRSAAGKPLVVPEFRVAELRNAVEKLGGDLCISRPKERLSWGIEFPFDPEFVTYVWFDALVNYISFAPGYDPAPARPPEPFLRWWRTALHDIGKDILIPAHGVYWPVMLKSLGFADNEMPTLLVHGWWNNSGEKMSKSLGNIVDPDALADKYGAEALRYYLMSDISTGKDSDFSEERLIQRYNTDLANSLGNLLNRSLSMASKYREGTLMALSQADYANLSEADQSFPSHVGSKVALFRSLIEGVAGSSPTDPQRSDGFQFHDALSRGALAIASQCNEHVELTAPWKLAKDPAQSFRLDAVLYHLAESLRIIAILISPVLPKAAHGIFDQLNWKIEQSGHNSRFTLADAAWGGLSDGHVLGKPVPLFPRIEIPAT